MCSITHANSCQVVHVILGKTNCLIVLKTHPSRLVIGSWVKHELCSICFNQCQSNYYLESKTFANMNLQLNLIVLLKSDSDSNVAPKDIFLKCILNCPWSTTMTFTPNFNRCQSIYYLTNKTFENNLQLNRTVGIEIWLGFECLTERRFPPSKKSHAQRIHVHVVNSNGRVGFGGRWHIKVRLKMTQLMSLNKDVQAPRYTIRILASYCLNFQVLPMFEKKSPKFS
jgi:hypothetical protein